MLCVLILMHVTLDARLNCIGYVCISFCFALSLLFYYYSLCELDARNTHPKYSLEAFKTGLGLVTAFFLLLFFIFLNLRIE